MGMTYNKNSHIIGTTNTNNLLPVHVMHRTYTSDFILLNIWTKNVRQCYITPKNSILENLHIPQWVGIIHVILAGICNNNEINKPKGFFKEKKSTWINWELR